jgi:hypothetical protein
MQGGLKVKRSLFSLGLACFAVAAALPASAQINTNQLPEGLGPFGPFNLAEAYPCAAAPYATGAEATSITPLQVFNGTGTNCGNGSNNGTPGVIPGAAPGILCLQRPSGSLALDVNCFVSIPHGQEAPCFVQAYRLYKFVPGSFKCPDVYGLPHFDKDGNLIPYQYVQFGSGVRTWWSLNFTQPGTRFLLQVISVCHVPQPTVDNVPVAGTVASSAIHVDSWRWRVVADDTTLLYVIYLMHGGAVSTLEVPCILGEDMYDALVKAQTTLHNAINEPPMVTPTGQTITVPNNTRTTDIGNAIFNMEALIVANCLFVEVLNPLVVYPGPAQFGAPNIQPPGNLAQTVTFSGQGSAVAGIIDTIEHPCCCKLLVDLEWIAIKNSIVGQTPTLPTF